MIEFVNVAPENKSIVLFSHDVIEVLHESVTAPTAVSFLPDRGADSTFIPKLFVFITNIVISCTESIFPAVTISIAN